MNEKELLKFLDQYSTWSENENPILSEVNHLKVNDLENMTSQKMNSFKFKMISSLLGNKLSTKWLKNEQFKYLIKKYTENPQSGIVEIFSFMSSIYDPRYKHNTIHHKIVDKLFYNYVHQFDREYTGKTTDRKEIPKVLESLNKIIQNGIELRYDQLSEFLLSEIGKEFFIFGQPGMDGISNKSKRENNVLYLNYPELSEFIAKFILYEHSRLHLYEKWLYAAEECSAIKPSLYINMQDSKNGQQILKKSSKVSPYRFLNTLSYFNTYNSFHLFNIEMIDFKSDEPYQKITQGISNIHDYLDNKPYTLKGDMDTILSQRVLEPLNHTKNNMLVAQCVRVNDSEENIKKDINKNKDLSNNNKNNEHNKDNYDVRVEKIANNIRLLPDSCISQLHVINSLYKRIQEQSSFINEEQKNDVERMFHIKIAEIIQTYLSIEKEYRETKVGVQGKNATELMLSSFKDIEETFNHIVEDINIEKLTKLSVQQRYINTVKNQHVSNSTEVIKFEIEKEFNNEANQQFPPINKNRI